MYYIKIPLAWETLYKPGRIVQDRQQEYLASHASRVDEHLEVVLWHIGSSAVLGVIQVSLEGMLVSHHSVMPPPQPHKGVGGHVQQVPHAGLPRPWPRQSVC